MESQSARLPATLGALIMAKVAACAVVLLALIATQLVFNPTASSQEAESVATATKPSVAALVAQRRDDIFSGTGFMVADRLVLTAYHTVEGASRILAKFPDYHAVEAKFVSGNRTDDVALLSIPMLPVRPLPLGDIGQVREGQTIVVISFPRIDVLGARTPTITQGIVSAIRPGLLQMQVPVSPGSSGGPVLTLRGEVIGIVRSTLRGEQQGINFATPINAAKPLLGSTLMSATPSPAPPQSSPQPVTPSVPTAPVPTPSPSTPPQPTPPPTVPAPPAPSTPTHQFLISPGQGIGRVRVGMSITDVVSILGRPKVTMPYSNTDNNTLYSWFDYARLENSTTRFNTGGLIVLCTPTGQVIFVQAYYAPEYVTIEGLHTGVSEEQVRSALGEPTTIEKIDGGHSLIYSSRGITFRISDDPHARGYRTVFLIKVYAPQP